MPMSSIPRSSSAVSAAPISEPSNMVPVVSTVTCAKIGMSTPAVRAACLAPTTAALACSRSWAVSMSRASAPPAMSPAAHSVYASRSWL